MATADVHQKEIFDIQRVFFIAGCEESQRCCYQSSQSDSSSPCWDEALSKSLAYSFLASENIYLVISHGSKDHCLISSPICGSQSRSVLTLQPKYYTHRYSEFLYSCMLKCLISYCNQAYRSCCTPSPRFCAMRSATYELPGRPTHTTLKLKAVVFINALLKQKINNSPEHRLAVAPFNECMGLVGLSCR